MHLSRSLLTLSLAGASVLGSAQAQEPVGETVFARGAATAQVGDNVRLIGKGTPIFEGDVLSTGGRSFAIVSFSDGTRMTLRPDTVFEVQQFRNRGERPNALMRLFKGGFRAVTGAITRLNPFNGFRVQTTLATIGIRGTDFSARLCEADCAAEAQARAESQTAQERAAEATPAPSRVVARVAFLRGSLNGQTTAGDARALRTGAAIYEGDTLETGRGSFAVLAFRDRTRVTMQVSTVFRVAAHRYEPQRPSSSFSLMSLLKGGLRIATGLIGRVNRRQFRIGTPVATIGIRGTSFDLVCQGSCVGDATASAPGNGLLGGLLDYFISPAYALPPEGDGLYILSREGGLYAEQDGREVNLPEGQNMFLRNIAVAPEIGVEVPLAVQEGLGPLPESVEIPDNFFAAEPLPEEPGLIVAVYDEGHATVEQVDGTISHLGRDEALHTNGTQMLNILGGPPPVIKNDPYNFRPGDFTGASLLNSAGLPNVTQTDDALECRI